MVLPDSHKVSRAPWYSGAFLESHIFRIPDFHRLWSAFPCRSAIYDLGNSMNTLQGVPEGPTTPHMQRVQAYTYMVWALPVSLAATTGIDLLLSFPAGT